MNKITEEPISGLNPCCNGRYSQSNSQFRLFVKRNKVLILVLMEDTLRERTLLSSQTQMAS